MSATSSPSSLSAASLSDGSGPDGVSTKKHPRFYFEGGGCVSFLAENTLYSVHKHFFTMHSPWWAQKLAGETNASVPIQLKDVSVRDMDALLSIFYSSNFQGKYDLATVEEWKSVLLLSTKWEFAGIRALSLDQLKPLVLPVQKLAMSRAYNIPGWLEPALMALCVRKDPLTLEEAKQLSIEDVVFITSTHEALRQKTQASVNEVEASSYVARHIHPTSTSSTAQQSFAAPIKPQPVQLQTTQNKPATMPDSAEVRQLTAEPSADDIKRLVTFLRKPDFAGALSMVTLESTTVFVDIMNSHTNIRGNPFSSMSFADATLRRGAMHASFIPTGVRLLSLLANDVDIPIRPADNSFSTCMRHTSKMFTEVQESVERSASVNDNFAEAIREARSNGAHWRIFTFLNLNSTPTRASYEERKANLAAFLGQLSEEGLFLV